MASPLVATSIAVHEAMLVALSGAQMACPVYDVPPAGAVYPYATVAGPMALPAHMVAQDRSELLFYVAIFSTYRGRAEVAHLLDVLATALHDAPLSPTTGAVVRMSVERQEIVRDADEMTFQGAMTLKVLIEH